MSENKSNYKIGGYFDAGNILEAGFNTPNDPASGGIWVCDKVRGYCIDEESGGDFPYNLASVTLTIIGDISWPAGLSVKEANGCFNYMYKQERDDPEKDFFHTNFDIFSGSPVTGTLIWPKNLNGIEVLQTGDSAVLNSGDATYDSNTGTFIISGDCNITVYVS